ncbi:MAG: hypothetical protein WD712_00450, partial [Candidatus Spechtbacterales bacterium]
VSNTDFAACEDTSPAACNDADIGFDVTTGNLTVADGRELHVWTGDTFTPGGTVTTSPSSSSSSADGDVHIATSAVLTMASNALSVGGDFNNEGTFSKTAPQTTTFTATSTGHAITTGASNFDDVTFNGTGGGWEFTASDTIEGILTMTAGTLTETGADTLTVQEDVTGTAGVINFTGTSTLEQRVAQTELFGSTTANTDWTFYNLTFSQSAGTAVIDTNLCSDCDVTVTNQLALSISLDGAGVTLQAGDKTWSFTSANQQNPFENDGQGADAGVLTPETSTFTFSGDSDATTVNIENVTFNNLNVGGATAETYVVVAGTITVNSNLTVNASGTFDVNTNDNTLDIGGNLLIAAAGAFFQASNSASLTIAGNINDDNDTALGFVHNAGTVTMDTSSVAAIGGNCNAGTKTDFIVFNNFKVQETAGKTLNFEIPGGTCTGGEIRFEGKFTVEGASGNLINIDSSSAGVQWLIDHQGTESVQYTNIQDSGCGGSTTNISLDDSSTESTNVDNTCWLFPDASFTLNAVSVSLDLNSGNTFTSTNTSTLTVASQSEFGYDMYAYETQLLTRDGGSETIQDFQGTYAAPENWVSTCTADANDCGWGYNTDDTSIGFGSNYARFASAASAPGDIVADSAVDVTVGSEVVHTITYKSSVDAIQAAGNYLTTIVYILVPKF